jgi:hypothetical protein
MAGKRFDPAKHCGAHPDSPKGPCRAPKGSGTDHPGHGRCRHHGGNTPSGRQHGHKEAAQAAMSTFGIGDAGTDDPIGALMGVLRHATAAAAFCEAQIAALEPDQLIRGTRSVRRTVTPGAGPNGGDTVTTVTEAGTLISPWLDLLARQQDRVTKVSAVLLQHGVDQLALQIEQQAVTDLVAVIRGILDDLHLSSEQQALVPDVVPTRLRALQGGRGS